ncbi:MAG: 6-bladed beta-propeller [Acidobacteriota bacterium]|nr:6-bladed beta-propeller [Acidobacteriota bacterium]
MFVILPAFSGDVIKNGKRHQGRELVFTEELRIGGEDRDETDWARTSTSVSVDSKGRIYVTDPGEGRVVVFDARGNYLKTIGGRGQAPGEFLDLHRYEVQRDDTALVFDRSEGSVARIHRFDTEGKFVSRREYTRIVVEPVMSTVGGKLAALVVSHDPKAGKMFFRHSVLSPELKTLKLLSDESGPAMDRSRLMDGNYWVERIARNLRRAWTRDPVYNFDHKGRLIVSRPTAYEITVWESDLKTKALVFSRDYDRIAYDDAFITAFVEGLVETILADPDLGRIVTPIILSRAVDKAELTPFKPPVAAIIPMDDGHILVVHDVNLATRETRADIFSAAGRYMGQVTMGDFALARTGDGLFLPRMVFSNGAAYTVMTDEEGSHSVVRFRYHWKQ